MKKFAILCHRWTGTLFCILFAWWFVSGIFMIYVDFPEVRDSDRRSRAQTIDASRVNLTAAEAWATLNIPGEPDDARLLMVDARPAFLFGLGSGRAVVFADSGETRRMFTPEQNLRTAAAWSGQPGTAARVEAMRAVDQWTVGGIFRQHSPLTKYSWPDGQQVYIAARTGEVVQYTTTRSRVLAYLGPVAHWLYFTPLRKNGQLWSRIVIWLSGAATVVALLGLYAGLSLYAPSKKIPFRGTKRLHVILGLFFGFLACTWAFSGMLSMDPFPVKSKEDTRIPESLVSEPFGIENFAAKSPRQALRGVTAKELAFVSAPGASWYVAVSDGGQRNVIPVAGNFDVVDFVRKAGSVRDVRWVEPSREVPVRALFVELNDAVHSRFYIDPVTARVVGDYSSDQWVERWLYHGLHWINIPWLYDQRPAWDILVLVLMIGGSALSITSVIIGWRFVRKPPLAYARGSAGPIRE